MDAKPYSMDVTCSSEWDLDDDEEVALKDAFRTSVVQVLGGSKRADLPPFPEININSGRGPAFPTAASTTVPTTAPSYPSDKAGEKPEGE